MRRVMVRYRVKPDRAAENQTYIEAVFAELAQKKPAGIRYATFKLDDGVSFIHIASVETADGHNPLTTLTAFQQFGTQIRDRCDEPPVTTTLSTVGAYGFFEPAA